MSCSLLILYARDSENIKNELLQQLKTVLTHCVCVDDSKFVHHQALKDPSSSRLQIVFFSPAFLSFLECRPEEAYASFRNLDPRSTVALFCCGLREKEVMCYHTAPLKSFYSWPKFEASRDEENQNRFSTVFLQMIKDIFPDKKSPAREIIISPELINKESTHIYIIFPDEIQNIQDLSVQLEGSSCIQTFSENINPYVLQIAVPEGLVESCDAFTVKIQQSDIFLAQKLIKIYKDKMVPEKTVQNDFYLPRSSKILKLDEQLQVLKDIGGSLETLEEDLEEKGRTFSPQIDDMTMSLKEMCRKYGLEELSALIDEPLMSVADICAPDFSENLAEQHNQNQDTGIQQNDTSTTDRNLRIDITSVDDADGCSGIIRSMSLPTILPQPEENHGGYGDYLLMEFPCARPRFHLLSSSDGLSVSESNLSSSTYVTMKRRSGVFEAANKELAESQEDLLKIMHAFKSGQATLSDVEKRFQQWQEKHNPRQKLPTSNEKEDPLQFSDVLKRPNRKISDASENVKRFSGSSSQSRLSSTDTWRKFSSTSISSSNSSKTSDASSNLTVHSQQHRIYRKFPHEISTGWIPSYSTTKCQFFPTSDLPPLPTRPRPSSKSKETTERSFESRASAKRKAGTYVPPVLNDLKINKNQENEDQMEVTSVEPLIQICEKYGLRNLGDYFFNELNQHKEVETKPENQDISPKKITNEFLNQSCLQLSMGEWDPENTSSLRRSLSLPNTLLPTEENEIVQENTANNPNTITSREGNLSEAVLSKCEEYINSIQSNIYMSIQNYISMQNQNEACQTNNLSVSQRELLEIMNAFKRGEKTISQVESQFQEWHMRHMEAATRRDQQLLQMKNQYEKAQKSSTFGLKKLILGKPKNKNPKSSVASNNRSVRRNGGKSDRNSKRLSKLSYTSTSSGVSDNGDVFKNACYFNPGYGETIQVSRNNIHGSKLSSSSPEFNAPPPLPPRPPLAPVAVLKHGFSKEEFSDAPEAEKSPAKSTGSSPLMAVKQRPSPPPKPANLFKKVSCSSSVEYEKNQDGEKAQVIRPESPEYIVPNKVVRGSSKKNLHRANSKETNTIRPVQCDVPFEHVCAKKNGKHVSGACAATNTNPQVSKNKEKTLNSSAKISQNDNGSLKRQLLLLPPWPKSKKEESMFYIKRRCSSVPELQSLELQTEPTYLDLQELWDNRNRSISESNVPVE